MKTNQVITNKETQLAMQDMAPLNQNQNQKPKRQKGNAILFTLLALVIGGIVISVGITQYQDAERAVRIQSTISEVNTIIGLAKQNYGQYRYAGLDTQIAMNSLVIPAELHFGAAAANKFGGNVTLNGPAGAQTPAPGAATPAPTAAASGGVATLIYDGVPRELCTAIVNGTQGVADTVKVGATDIKTAAGISIANLNTGCSAATGAASAPIGSAGAVTITWTFSR